MQKKQVSIIPKSMQQDLAVSQFPADAAYTIRNMRVVTTGDDTSLCLVNEKSNSEVLTIQGTVIGTQVINNCAILFVTGLKGDKPDAIYKITSVDGKLQKESELYRGNLGFDAGHPIESIGIYENEEIQKVYWVDGKNQPRLINICNSYGEGNDTQFDFIPKIVGDSKTSPIQLEVSIASEVNAVFDGGVIQYAIAYFNKYGQETPTIYQSALYYTSDNGRGLNPDGSQKSASAFKLVIKNLDSSFDYCRIYRIMRTSINATPSVEYIGDFKSESSYEEEYSISSLTNNVNNPFSLRYGDNSWSISSGLIDGILGLGQDSKVFKGTDAVTHQLDCAIINPRVQLGSSPIDVNTNKPFYITDRSTGITYIIPANKSAKMLWSSITSDQSVEKQYQLTIADDDNPLGESSEESIIGKKTISGTVVYDTGTTGTTVDPSELLYLGGTELIAGTLSHKDGTLFLGNISTEKSFIEDTDKNEVETKSTLEYILESVTNNSDDSSYLDIQWNTNSNLLRSNKDITFFQKGEVYRFGVQFLSKRGVWSEVVYLGDKENSLRVVPNTYNDGVKQRPIMRAKVYIPESITKEYVAARLVCVYPTIYDRNVLCQGIVCPTVYNLGDRNDNSPYVQSSWFARPSYSRYNQFSNAYIPSKSTSPFLQRGAPLEYRMVSKSIRDSYKYKDAVIGLPDSEYFNSEIFGVVNTPKITDYTGGTPTRESIAKDFKNAFGIDKRIVTLHSPELDNSFNDDIQNISLSGIKFRVIGFAPVKTTLSDIDVSYTNPFVPNYSGVYNDNIESPSSSNNHISGYSLVNYPMWIDGIALGTNETYPGNVGGEYKGAASYPIYPWHRSGSLSNQGKTDSTENRKSLLKTKVMSSLRICLPSVYLEEEYNMQISNVELWSSTDSYNTIKVLNTKKLWGASADAIYKGEIDKVLTCEGNGDYDEHKIRIQNWNISKNPYYNVLLDLQYPRSSNYKYTKIDDIDNTNFVEKIDLRNIYSSDPIPIQYRSTGHAVFAFGKVKEGDYAGRYEILPNISNGDYGNETVGYPFYEDGAYLPLAWLSKDEESTYTGIYQKELRTTSPVLNFKQQYTQIDDTNDDAAYYFVVGELYRDSVTNRFGGTSEQAKANNTWCPCGDIVYFNNSGIVTLYGNQGDTFLGRYDHLKTYPLANDNVNRVVDIVSFCCETRINVDGRYDRNRGNKNNLAVSPTNFNLFNKVYSQRNTFFNYAYLREDDTSVTKFPNQIMWSKTKTLGEDVDSWTNINAANVMDLDGDKGELQALRRFNNDIYAFQDTGISKVIFNPRVQINASDGVPIEIANSGKVDGKVYLTDKYGCQNKWSITETPSGLYFVDDLNQGILSFNGQNIVDLTYTKNMYSWINSNVSLVSWNPKDYGAIRTFYDRNNSDIYFTTNTDSLVFSERLGAFSSFYDYGKVGWMFNIEGNTYQIKNNKVWKLHGGENYGTFFGENKEYSLAVIANPEFQLDKIFDTVEFRTNGLEHFTNWEADSYPFNSLVTTNEYQTAVSTTSSLKKKFRTWRWQVGRNNTFGKFKRDRIRNPWAKITMSGNSDKEMRLYDIVVTYYT